MNVLMVLIVLSLIWVATLVLALVVYLGASAVYLHRARASVAQIADNLEVAAAETEPLGELVGNVAYHAQAIHDDISTVKTGLRSVVGALSEPANT